MKNELKTLKSEIISSDLPGQQPPASAVGAPAGAAPADERAARAAESDAENLVFTSADTVSDCEPGMIMLGELLRFIRKEKLMSLYLTIKNAKDVTVTEKNIEILLEERDYLEISSNESHVEVVKKFFGDKGFSVKFNELRRENPDLERLNALLDGKLVIKP